MNSKIKIFLFSILFSALFGCQNQNVVEEPLATVTAITATTIPNTITPMPSPTQIPPSATPIPPTAIPTIAPINCYTPPSLMLHSAFGVSRMRKLVEEIKANNLITITYEQLLYEYLELGQCAPDNAIIVSLDDLGTEWLRPDFQYMIKVFLENDLTLVAGVVTNQPANPEVWKYLREIQSQGIELASHTHGHLNLTLVSPYQLEIEVLESYQQICDNTASCPITLILPFGEGSDHQGVLDLSKGKYSFLVEIQGGLQFNDPPPYILGRIPPDNDSQEITLILLENTFAP